LFVIAKKLSALAVAVLCLITPPSQVLSGGATTTTIFETQITGEFELIGKTGKVVNNRDFRGQYMVVFLGYTFCPDICPTDLQAIADTLDLMGDKAQRVQPIFITLDPERDTPEVLADYVANFHPRMIGLTGDKDQVRKAADAFGAKYYKVFGSPTSEDNQDKDAFYLMNHSAVIYLFGPEGDYLGHFPHGADAKGMANELKLVIE
jgi:protein SCO1